MQFKNYGRFSVNPDSGTLFFINEAGESWYQLLMGQTPTGEVDENGNPTFKPPLVTLVTSNGSFISSVHPAWATMENDGTLAQVDFDPTKLIPADKSVIGFDMPIEFVQKGARLIDGELLPPLPAEPIPTNVYVHQVWERMTDEEAEAFDSAMATATPLRLRRAFLAATAFLDTSELYTFVRGILLSQFTSERVDEILGV